MRRLPDGSSPFFIPPFSPDGLGFRAEPFVLQILVPIGLSFYTFQALTYPLDIYRRQLSPSKSLLDVALFVAFFPQLAAGPIERAKNILPQLERRRQFDLTEFEKGAWLFFWGLFKKVFVADNLALLVNDRFELKGLITHVAFYAGWPCAVNAGRILIEVCGEK